MRHLRQQTLRIQRLLRHLGAALTIAARPAAHRWDQGGSVAVLQGVVPGDVRLIHSQTQDVFEPFRLRRLVSHRLQQIRARAPFRQLDCEFPPPRRLGQRGVQPDVNPQEFRPLRVSGAALRARSNRRQSAQRRPADEVE